MMFTTGDIILKFSRFLLKPIRLLDICRNPTFVRSKHMAVSRSIVFWVTLVTSFSYYLYTPLPEEAAEPWKQMMTSASVRIISDLSALGQMIGIASAVNITRALTENIKYFHFSENVPLEKLQIYEDVFDGVKVRIYRPNVGSEGLPGIIHIHGGGWTLLSVDAYDGFTKELAVRTESIVVSVEYRLSPEYPFPVPFEDCVRAASHFLKHAKNYGCDETRVAIIGDSAGGNLAMAVALNISQEDSVPNFKTQGLIYPALQAFDFNTPSYQTYCEKVRTCPSFATKEVLITYWQLYAFGELLYSSDFFVNNHTSKRLKESIYAEYVDHKHLPQSHFPLYYDKPATCTCNDELADRLEELLVNPDFAPLMASDEQLKKMPNTYILTAEYDALRDDGFLLVKRLKNLGHPHEHKHFGGLEHGFCLMLHYQTARDFMEGFAEFLGKNL